MIQGFAKYIFCPLLIVFFTLGLSSCHKKITPVTPKPVARTVDVEEIEFGYLHGKARLVYKDDKKEKEVKAHIRVRKDSVIWMTLNVAGVAVGKGLINKDSITIVSNIDKEYYVFEYAELSKKFNFQVTYEIIEAAILGNLIQKKNENDVITHDGNFDILTQALGEVRIKNSINKTTKKIEKVELNEPTTGNSLKINYSDFQPLANRSFAYLNVTNVVYKTVNGIISNTITVEFNKAEVGDKELKFPFHIPRKYDRR